MELGRLCKGHSQFRSGHRTLNPFSLSSWIVIVIGYCCYIGVQNQAFYLLIHVDRAISCSLKQSLRICKGMAVCTCRRRLRVGEFLNHVEMLCNLTTQHWGSPTSLLLKAPIEVCFQALEGCMIVHTWNGASVEATALTVEKSCMSKVLDKDTFHIIGSILGWKRNRCSLD